MKVAVIIAATVIGGTLLARTAGAFVPSATAGAAGLGCRRARTTTFLRDAVTLEPEPEGGEELAAASTVPGCRVKKMAAVTDVTSEHGDVYEFWMTAVAEGAMIQEIRSRVLKDASKKANFPGFKKVRSHRGT